MALLRRITYHTRCKTRGCDWCESLAWRNYIVKGGQHLFRGVPCKLRCFMIRASFGVSVRYLQQLHLRMLREHVTFAGKAYVAREVASSNGSQGVLPGPHLRLHLAEAWSKWRLVLRMERMVEGGQPDVHPDSLVMSDSVEECVGRIWPEVQLHFEKTTRASELTDDPRKTENQAVDGN